MSTTTNAAALSMKLLIDQRAQRVLFAEASKDVVDFLFSLLALPIATGVKLVGKEAMVGSVGNLYASVDKLDSTCALAGAAKDALLYPTVLSPAATTNTNSSLLRLPDPSSPSSVQPKKLYICASNTNTNSGGFGSPSCGFGGGASSSCRDYITEEHGKACPRCHCSMTTAAQYLPSSAGPRGGCCGSGGQVAAEGFVQGVVTYTVLDDLTVTPMSAISCVTLLNMFAVRDIGDLHERTVQLGYNEGLAILKASLQSKSVLTDVFVHGNKEAPGAGVRA